MPYSIGVIVAFFLALILAGKRQKSQADIFLNVWLFFLGFHLLLYQNLITVPLEKYPFLLGLELPLPLVHGPFLYLYVRVLTLERKISKIHLLHFLPFVVFLVSLISFFLLPETEKIRVYQEEGAGYELLLSLLYGSIILSGPLYLLLSLRLYLLCLRAIRDHFSSTTKIKLSWLLYLILGSSVVWLIVIFGEDQLIYGSIACYILLIGFFGIKQVGVFTNIPVNQTEIALEALDSEPSESTPEKAKYEKSILTPSQISDIHRDLSQLMGREKLFTNPELSLSELAQRLDVHPNTLSQVINTSEQRNFFDYVNGLRVEEFKRLAMDPQCQNSTLLALAFECGFNSKTSFNRNFKKATGLSPSEFLNQSKILLR